jgi:hypothetical protein
VDEKLSTVRSKPVWNMQSGSSLSKQANVWRRHFISFWQ